jgi:hypothetical protein
MSSHARACLFFAVAAFSSCLWAVPAEGGAWTVRRGHYWFEFYWQQYVSTARFEADGRRRDLPDSGRFREFRNEGKAELPSWDDRLNFLVSLPIDGARYENIYNYSSRVGLEEMSVATKWRLNQVRSPLIVALQPGVNFPLGCRATDAPPLGDCQVDVEGRVIVSRALRRNADGLITGYANGELGYRYRFDAPTDEMPFFAEVASRLGASRLWAKALVDGVTSRHASAFEEEEDYAKWSASLMVGDDPTSRNADESRPKFRYLFEVGLAGVFAGRSTGAGGIVFLKFAVQQ